MHRYWFLTWRTYGTWLPGDERGFVDPVIDEQGNHVIHNVLGTPMDADEPALRAYSRQVMKAEPVFLNAMQASDLLVQFQETCRYRGWKLLALSIMANHVHVILEVLGDPDPSAVLRDLKSYGSRRLNQTGPRPANGSWWSESGSKRRLQAEENVRAAIVYVVQDQPNPLLTWSAETQGERPA